MRIEDTNGCMEKIEKELVNIKLKAFGKITLNKKNKRKPTVQNLIQKQNVNDIIRKHNQNIKNQKEEIREVKIKKVKVAAIFNLCEDIIGKEASSNDPVVVTDPETGIDVMDPEEIKRVSLKYCVNILTNKEPKEEYKKQFKFKEELHEIRMLEKLEGDINELSDEMFYEAIRKVTQESNINTV